jgi:hypothetical protein
VIKSLYQAGGQQMIDIGLAGIVLALLWIGWELHRIAKLVAEFLLAFSEAYLEFMKPRGN